MIDGNGDRDYLWRVFVDKSIYHDEGIIRIYHPCSVQEFLGEFKKYVVDIMEYPYDREKRYTVIKERKNYNAGNQQDKKNARLYLCRSTKGSN